MTEIRRRGPLPCLAFTLGAGKTTITRRLLDRDPLLRLSISVTTRPKRPGEVDGADYYFVTPA